MTGKVLVANRGEIALRIIRSCRELGLRSVAIFSKADADSLHRLLADEAVCVGPARAADSYLNIPSILAAAEVSGADMVHPGYGFLSENAQLAEACERTGLTFVGPGSSVISCMGDKAEARNTARTAGVPVVPGSQGLCATPAEVKQFGAEVGYPLLIKASAGGGGQGMRMVADQKEVDKAYGAARREARASFGDDSVYVERYLQQLRHVEIQVLADAGGNVLVFPERDCSVQRKHQKLLEESPAPHLKKDIRNRMFRAATELAEHLGYLGAGTVEFALSGDDVYFIEMNTRLQVEHPVTEMVSGVDLVAGQLIVAAGGSASEALARPSASATIPDGAAIELRINAEDPTKGFLPQMGPVELYQPPGGPGVRIDSHLYPGYEVGPHYDSLLAKLIVHARDRQSAISRGLRALDEFAIGEIETTIPLHLAILDDKEFKEGGVTTKYLEGRKLTGKGRLVAAEESEYQENKVA